MTPEELAAEATRLADQYKLGNKVSACRELAASPNRGELYALVEAQIEATEKKNFERLYKTFANR